jgi:uncharacterized membrane protein YvlD (DUF360 family)
VVRVLAKLLIVALVIACAPAFSSDIVVAGVGPALLAAVVYGVLFVLIGWAVAFVITMLSIVPGILTFGLFFLLVPSLIHTVLLKVTAGLLGSFEIRSWSAAFGLGLTLGVVNWLLTSRNASRR